MGAIIKFKEVYGDKPVTIASIYKHGSSEPEFVGLKLAEFLKNYKIVNGFPSRNDKFVANGAGCLAAQFIKEYKDGVGTVYMTTDEHDDESFLYEVHIKQTEIVKIIVEDSLDEENYTGGLKGFLDFCKKNE